MIRSKRTVIAERKELKLRRLQESYAAGQWHLSPIHAYNSVDAQHKAALGTAVPLSSGRRKRKTGSLTQATATQMALVS